MDISQKTKVRKRIKVYATFSLLCVVLFFATSLVSGYFFNLLESGAYYPSGGLVTATYITFLSLVGYILSIVGFVIFAILARTSSKELAKISPQNISGEKVKKLNSRNSLAMKILLIALVALILITILNDPSILSQENLK